MKIDYGWTGKIAVTVNHIPQIGKLTSNIYYSQGYSGHGVNMTHLAGKLISEAISGTMERFDLFKDRAGEMTIKCGIVGLPNVGKSTLFNALTAAEIPAENYPFCTIEPNIGMVQVPDTRLDSIAQIVRPEKTIPTTMEFVDIAGLVKGAPNKGNAIRYMNF